MIKKKLMVAWYIHFKISMWMKVQDILENYNRYSKILDCTISDQKKVQFIVIYISSITNAITCLFH